MAPRGRNSSAAGDRGWGRGPGETRETRGKAAGAAGASAAKSSAKDNGHMRGEYVPHAASLLLSFVGSHFHGVTVTEIKTLRPPPAGPEWRSAGPYTDAAPPPPKTTPTLAERACLSPSPAARPPPAPPPRHYYTYCGCTSRDRARDRQRHCKRTFISPRASSSFTVSLSSFSATL